MGDAGDKSMGSLPVDPFHSSFGNWEDAFLSFRRPFDLCGLMGIGIFRNLPVCDEIPDRKRVPNVPDCEEIVDGKSALDVADLQHPETVFAWVDNAADECRIKDQELQVKVPIEYVSCIGSLKQRGFDKIVQITPTYIIVLKKGKACTGSTKTKTLCIKKLDKLARRLAPTSYVNAAVVPRGNIASSSNPHNLICSQTLAVQNPSESAGEQFHQFQHSNPAFPSGPVGMGNGNEGAGLERYSLPEVPECGIQTKKRPYHGRDVEDMEKRKKRPHRGRDLEDKKKLLLLKYKLQYLENPANAAKLSKWSTFVAVEMIKDRSDRDPWRTPLAVRRQWDNLKKGRDALLKFTPANTNYWALTIDEKRAIRKKNPNLPLTFDYEWFRIMQDIDKMKGITAANKETQRDGQEGIFSQSLASTITGTGNFAGTAFSADCLEMPGNESDSETEAMNLRTDEEVFSDESGASLESHTDMATVDGQAHDLSQVASDEDSQFAKIRTFVNQQIDKALRPWINALRSREADELKHRQKTLAIEREKLALMRQKMECIRRFNAVPASVAKWRGKPPSL